MGRRGGWLLVTCGLLVATSPGCNDGDTVTAPVLSATCSATPAEGEAPLQVAFALSVAGAEGPVSVLVSYGDGTTGADPDATHVYGEGGLYTASFTISTTTQSARCSTPVEVSAATGVATGTGDGNLPPVITFKTTPNAVGGGISGTAPFKVRYNVCLTADPEGNTLHFTMDLDGDGKLDVRGSTGASCRADWTYALGTWFAEVCVTDLAPDGERLHPYQCEDYTLVAKP
jgi:PKD repeat protein